jgi:hypothetical protein
MQASFYPPKITYVGSIVIKNISKERIMDTSFWCLLMLPAATQVQRNDAANFYDILPWLKAEPLEASLVGGSAFPRIIACSGSTFRALGNQSETMCDL